MKKMVLAVLGSALLIGSAFSQDMKEPRTVEVIVGDIERQQNVTSIDNVTLEKVSPAVLEELGDAVMEVLIGNPAMHDRMDRMIGGDGSPQLNAFHTDLGLQYLRNKGIDGVRMGGMWGTGRFGMMYGWGASRDWSRGQPTSVDGKLDFLNNTPVIQASGKTYVLGFPEFFYYAYINGFKKGDQIHVEGYLFTTAGDANLLLTVAKAEVNGKSFDFSGAQVLPGRQGMMGNGGMGGYGMMGGWDSRW